MRAASFGLVLSALVAGCVELSDDPLDPRWKRMDPALAPDMGWNSWLYFGEKVHPDVLRAAARGLVDHGLSDLGYVYIQIDGGWWTTGGSPGTGRDAAGRIVPDPEFRDMKSLVDDIHALGLKAGIYTDAGTTGCGTQHGSGGHYAEDIAQFAAWGFDFVKLDFCGGLRDGLDPPTAYAAFRAAMDANPQAKHMRLNVCEWGSSNPWTWAPGVGHSWRTGKDIAPEWVNWPNILRNFDANDHPAAAGPGRWNDPDHVAVGVWEGNLTFEESRAHFSMWAMQSAPLVLGTNVLLPSADTLRILGNLEVILIDQDALGEQARRTNLALAPDVEVWVKNVTGGKAVMILNRGEGERTVTLAWEDVGATERSRVRDPWARADLDSSRDSVTATLKAHDVALYRVNLR